MSPPKMSGMSCDTNQGSDVPTVSTRRDRDQHQAVKPGRKQRITASSAHAATRAWATMTGQTVRLRWSGSMNRP